MAKQIKALSDVVDWRLCIGCGACAYACPKGAVRLYNFPNEGIRPVVDTQQCNTCTDCLQVCPAVQSDYSILSTAKRDTAFEKEWGPILEVWEGYATDPEIRFKGSSGGALTALGTYCIEKAGMHGVLHIGADEKNPVLNCTRLSRSREELMAVVGSRYSPASVCDGLAHVENSPVPCVVIGKPAEISAVRNAQKLRPSLDYKVGLTLSFFCAETPSTGGTLALLDQQGVDPSSLAELRYRGQGWPGHFAPVRQGDDAPAVKLTYRESWAFLQAHRPWSTHLWPDGAGELADISCGDPWYEEPDGKNPGFSLVVVRTERGRQIVRGAMAAGYLTLTPAENWKVAKSQPGLLNKKGAVWGRRWALRFLGLPVTRFDGLDLWHCWRSLPLKEKFRSTFGTLRRAITRRLYRPLPLNRTSTSAVISRPELPAAEGRRR